MENRACSLNGHVLQTVCPCCQPCVWTLLFSLAVNRSHGYSSLLFSAQSRDLPKAKHDDLSTLRSFRCSSLVFPIDDNVPPTQQLHGYTNKNIPQTRNTSRPVGEEMNTAVCNYSRSACRACSQPVSQPLSTTFLANAAICLPSLVCEQQCIS